MTDSLPEYSKSFPELHRAAALGDHDAIVRCLARGDDVNATCECPHAGGGIGIQLASPLALAAGSKWGATAETVRLLIERGARKTWRAGETPPTVAAVFGWNGCWSGGDAERLAVLLQHGSPLPSHDETVARLVSHAAMDESADRLRVLFDAGLSPNPTVDLVAYTRHAEAGIEKAMAKYGFNLTSALSPSVVKLLETLPDDFKQRFENPKITMPSYELGAPSYLLPLHSAAAAGRSDCVRLLIERGANIHAVDSEGRTPVLVAKTVECIELLIAAGAVIASKSSGHLDDLLDELDETNTEQIRAAIRCRLQHGATFRHSDFRGDVLYFYAFSVNLPAVKLLLELGASIAGGEDGRTALHGFAWQYEKRGDYAAVDYADFTRTLLAAGIPPNAQDVDGNSPLHEAVAGDGANPSATIELLRAGANPNIRNKNGQTPLVKLYRERTYQMERAIPLLLECGANPNLRDHDGKNAVDLARDDLAMRSTWKNDALADLPTATAMLKLLEDASRNSPAES
ncbi:MAG: ankyrin repeat domain-containing protein [Planctomycetota bacterium]